MNIRWFRILALVLFWVIATDVLFQFAYRIVKKRFTWDSIYNHEVFIVDFLKPVNDERYLIPKTGYNAGGIRFDQYGFRGGKNTGSKTNNNIVFLGDSVLFGYGIDGDDSVPSQFSELYSRKTNSEAHVINAALPSFSLNQIAYKYIYEIMGKFPVEGIILQTYDPAQNFWVLSHDWDVTRNWYTGAARNDVGFIKKFTMSPAKYSSLFYLYWRFSGAYFISSHSYDPYTQDDLTRYRQSIRESLDTLVSNAKDAAYIILLPITRPKAVYEGIKEAEKIPIDILNSEFASYARSHPKMYFLDTTAFFRTYDDAEVFRDDCCHLTAKGAQLEAQYIADYIEKLKTDPR